MKLTDEGRGFIFAVAFVAFVAVSITVLWLAVWVFPTHAAYCDPEVRLTSLSLTGLNVSVPSRQVTGDWDARFEFQSNLTEVKYDDLESSIFYNGELLSRTFIPSFDQGTGELTVIEAHHSALNAFIGQREAFVSRATVTALAADMARGSVGFDVRMVGKINRYRLTVRCKVVPVTLSCNGASGNFNCGPRACKIK